MSKYQKVPWVLGGCSGRMITTPDGYLGNGFIADVDTLANAKLIVKAPEMLELLKRAEELIQENKTDEHMFCEEIRSLLLEIEGE